jgi:nucleoside-diphosphate-sugar epimerase
MKRWLIVGAGDVARRMAPLLRGRCHLFSLCRDAASARLWRTLGAIPLMGDLDDPGSLGRLPGLADGVFHFAPPPSDTPGDPRTRNLVAALERGHSLPQRLVYISTTGVYGDCQGAWIDECRPVNPGTERARRRVSAEAQLRAFGRRTACSVAILRAPGIYAGDRLPLERLRLGEPLPDAASDPWTNHIHADDLARAAVAAMFRGSPNRVYNVVDDSNLTVGAFYEKLATHFGLPVPARLPGQSLKNQISAIKWSFLAESRKIRNDRVKIELGLKLKYATIDQALSAQ